MHGFKVKDRPRSIRREFREIKGLRSWVFRTIPLFGLLPFCFFICSFVESQSLRLGIPLVVVMLIFVIVSFQLIKVRRLMVILGAFLVLPIFLAACLSFANFDFFSQRAMMTVFPKNLSPSAEFIFGTDYEGRDILATIVIGGMNAYLVATIATIVTLLVGIPIGLLLTANHGIFRGIASITTQFFEIIPQLFFVLIVLGVFNFWSAASAGTRLVAVYAIPMAGFAIGISALPSMARVVEARVMQIRSRRFVAALQSAAVSPTKILWYNILWKNCISEIVVQATFLFGATILIESALGYAFEIGFGELGTGGYLSWGRILAEARRAILFSENLWIVFFPILVTIMSILGVNIIGDSLVKVLRRDT